MMENNIIRVALKLAKEKNDPYYLRITRPKDYVILYDAEGKAYSVLKGSILPLNDGFSVYDEG